MKRTILPLIALSTSILLSGCETLGGVMEVMSSVAADEAAKRQDDPAAYQACGSAYEVCKANGGDSSACTAERNALQRASIKCIRVGVFNGTRAN